jgi:penicillin-binding protein 2
MDYRDRWELKDYLVGQVLERRLRLFHAGVFLVLLGFLLNFWFLQGVQGEDYARLAETNRLRRIPLKPTRGVIYDRNKEVIASTRVSLRLQLRRERGTDLLPQLSRLAPILGTTEQALVERLQAMRGRPLFEPLVVKEDVGLAELSQIEARREHFPSVEVEEEARRHYLEDALFSHAVGFVGEVSGDQLTGDTPGLKVGDIVGKSGIERTYDDWVRGDRGWKVVTVNNLGRKMGPEHVGKEPSHGRHLQLTIDARLQRQLIESLGDEVGAGVFLDTRTGEVLALASTPSFNPNLFADGISHEDWRAIAENPDRPLLDRAIASFHAPGSTFKVVLAVAGLDTNTITPEETMQCNGSAEHYGRRRLCWKRGGHGTVNMRKALAQSCNVYFYQLGRRLGIEKIHEYGVAMNLGRPTGIDVPGEEPGIMPSSDWKWKTLREPWYPGDTISVAIGQGYLAATPLQMAMVMSAIATGKLTTPHLRPMNAERPRDLAVDSDVLQVVRDALEETVQDGTGTRADLGGIHVAGKTGTAQVYKHSAGVDSDKLPKPERDHAWFVGYAPADRPIISFAVIVEHGGHGGATAAPIARDVLEVYFADPPVRKPAPTGRVTRAMEGSGVRTTAAR